MSSLCLKCGYSVTEPICASCITNEIKIWLHEKPIKKEIIKKIDKELKHLLGQIESLDLVFLPSRNKKSASMMKCIKCKKEMHLMCFYCVTNQASKIIRDNLEEESSIESFQESFNTDLYEHELNKKDSFLKKNLS